MSARTEPVRVIGHDYYGLPPTGPVLELVGELDNSGGYDWSVFSVYREPATGRMWWHTDGGCSCSSPREFLSLQDMDGEITGSNFTDLDLASVRWLANEYCPGDHLPEQRVQLMATVARLLDGVPVDAASRPTPEGLEP